MVNLPGSPTPRGHYRALEMLPRWPKISLRSGRVPFGHARLSPSLAAATPSPLYWAMLLAIDIGNTNTRGRRIKGEMLKDHFRVLIQQNDDIRRSRFLITGGLP